MYDSESATVEFSSVGRLTKGHQSPRSAKLAGTFAELCSRFWLIYGYQLLLQTKKFKLLQKKGHRKQPALGSTGGVVGTFAADDDPEIRQLSVFSWLFLQLFLRQGLQCIGTGHWGT